MGHSCCGTLLWDTLVVGHSYGTLLWDTLVGRSCRSPATRRIYTSMFRAPRWHGASQTRFPPRPRKSAWHCDITDVISPHGPPPTRSKHITRYQQSSRSPATRRVYTSVFRAPQWHGATLVHVNPRTRRTAFSANRFPALSRIREVRILVLNQVHVCCSTEFSKSI